MGSITPAALGFLWWTLFTSGQLAVLHITAKPARLAGTLGALEKILMVRLGIAITRASLPR